ncbi:MAG: response regulator transcription factor [Thermomicrobiales bacterium]|nr:response regulator transcription factor [Thermomicrobiales bacterium]
MHSLHTHIAEDDSLVVKQGKPLVLLVEDDPTLRSTLGFNLTREGYSVISAEDGLVALAAIEEHGSDLSLIILDVMLPGMNGLQVLRRVRQSLNTPVLMLSARGEENDRIDGLELGADDYVVKPFALRELLARVRTHVRRHNNPELRLPSVLVRGSLRIETDQRLVTVSDRELELRPKEFGLLATIALEPGRVFSREELLGTVWGHDVVVDARTVDVHISWLRNKLANAGMQGEVIRTVYGSGYRFVGSADESESQRLPSTTHEVDSRISVSG